MQNISIDVTAIKKELEYKHSLYLDRVIALISGLENNAVVISEAAVQIKHAFTIVSESGRKHNFNEIFFNISNSFNTTADVIRENIPPIYQLVETILNITIVLAEEVSLITSNSDIRDSLNSAVSEIKEGLDYFDRSERVLTNCLSKLNGIKQLDGAVAKIQAALSLFSSYILKLNYSVSIAEYHLKLLYDNEQSFVC